MFQSKCPQCGNVDIVSETEKKQPIHCQCCYHHYPYKENEYDKVTDLAGLVLWVTRRVHPVHRDFAYTELLKILGDEHELSAYINGLKNSTE